MNNKMKLKKMFMSNKIKLKYLWKIFFLQVITTLEDHKKFLKEIITCGNA